MNPGSGDSGVFSLLLVPIEELLKRGLIRICHGCHKMFGRYFRQFDSHVSVQALVVVPTLSPGVMGTRLVYTRSWSRIANSSCLRTTEKLALGKFDTSKQSAILPPGSNQIRLSHRVFRNLLE